MASDEVMEEAPAAESGRNPAAEMELMQLVFEAGLPDDLVPEKQALRERIIAEIKEQNAGPLYDIVCERLALPKDEALRAAMRKANEEELAKLDKAVADAREHHGDVEVAEAITKKAVYYGQIGDRAASLRTYAEVPQKSLSTGQKIDAAMAAVRLGFLHGDAKLAADKLALASELVASGGDWDRRNRLKVYQGVHALHRRDFAAAAPLLLDSIATFTAAELLPYPRFITYTVLACLKTLERPKLRKRVIESPDVLSVLGDIPHLGELLNALYECRYAAFTDALAHIYPALARDRLFAPAAPLYLRELRLAGYAQFLQSYKSVTLAGMARAFGLPPAFLDAELSRFIAAGRLPAKLDALGGVVETTRGDGKGGQFASVLKSGDGLLNRIQKLSRVVAV